MPTKVAEHTSEARRAGDRSGRDARALPALYRPSEASTASSLALRGVQVHGAMSEHAKRADVIAPFSGAPRKALSRSRAHARAPHAPRRLAEPSVAVKGRGAAQRARDPEAEVVPPRSEAQREKEKTRVR